MIVIDPIEDADPVRKHVTDLQAALQALNAVGDKKQRAFTTGRLRSGADAFARLYLLIDHTLRSLRRAYLDDMATPLAAGDDVCVTRWWRDPASGFSDVPQALGNFAKVYVEKSGIDPAKLAFLPANFAELAGKLGPGLCVVDSMAPQAKVTADKTGEVHLWLFYAYQTRKFAALYLAERKWSPPGSVPSSA